MSGSRTPNWVSTRSITSLMAQSQAEAPTLPPFSPAAEAGTRPNPDKRGGDGNIIMVH